MNDVDAIEAEFWRAFGRAMGRTVAPRSYRTHDIAEWDSLRHIELVFELESQFRIRVAPEAIAALYADTDTVLAYVRSELATRR